MFPSSLKRRSEQPYGGGSRRPLTYGGSGEELDPPAELAEDLISLVRAYLKRVAIRGQTGVGARTESAHAEVGSLRFEIADRLAAGWLLLLAHFP